VQFLALPASFLTVNLSLLDQRFDHLFDKEGIALRLLENSIGKLTRDASLSNSAPESPTSWQKTSQLMRSARRSRSIYQRIGKGVRAIGSTSR
jgi:hypothetical protein